MKRTIPVPAWIVASLLVCGTAGAQVRGQVTATRAPMARPAVVHVAPVGQPGAGTRALGIAPRTAVRRISGTQITPVVPNVRFVSPANRTHANGPFANSSDAPGLGFDYSDFFALHPNQNTIGRGRSNFSNGFAFFSPFGFYGYPYLSTDTSVPDQSPAPVTDQEAQPQQQQQPQIVIVMPPGYSAASNSATGAQTPSQASAAQAPATDTAIVSSEYVLLKRDGGVLFANAFTVQSGQMVYITPEGNRRKITLAELDVDATRKMNEERGTTITLPSDSSTR
jgi:hypothetical protein